MREVFLSKQYSVSEKGPGDPLTSADLLANQILRDGLRALAPGAGWLSEETPDDPERLERETVWVVDPIDGTREFVKGVPEFAVSVGLVRGGQAIAGWIGLPAEEALILGAPGLGVGRLEADQFAEGRSPRPAYAHRLSTRTEFDGAEVLFSHSEQRAGLDRPLADRLRVLPSGSIARKLGLLAAGQGDLCVSLRPKNEWDICGGIALVIASGGRCVALDPIGEHTFNRPSPRSYGLVAGPGPLVAAFAQWFEQAELSVERKHSS